MTPDIQCFTPEERARIYIISYLTGLRRKEIASLTPRSFALSADPPTVTVEAACSKHRRTDVLPLHPPLIEILPTWLRGLAPGQILFPKLAKRRTWLMVKKDLERVGIPYETPEGIADFHAAGRHTYITGLLRSGASLPETKELARHTDVKMTMKYAHIGIQDRAKAVAGLPFQECNRSKTVTADGHQQTSAVAVDASDNRAQETTNPGESRGYVVVCLPETPKGASERKWRRRERAVVATIRHRSLEMTGGKGNITRADLSLGRPLSDQQPFLIRPTRPVFQSRQVNVSRA